MLLTRYTPAARYTPDTVERPYEWLLRAACSGEDTELFYPGQGQGPGPALSICDACPVRLACLRDAMREEGRKPAAWRHGVRGGLTPEERRTLYERSQR